MTEEPLFEMRPIGRLQPGDEVFMSTIWGYERAEVVAVHKEDGFPRVLLKTEMGDTISIDVARVTRTEES